MLEQWGRVDVLFNNAIYQGPGTMDRFLDVPLELAERCLVGDYLHPMLLIQLLLPQMLERGEGRLVNMLSEAAFTTPPAPAGSGRLGRGATPLRRRPFTGSPTCATWSSSTRASGPSASPLG